MRSLPALVSISVVAALVAGAPRLASATPSYPSDLQTDLSLTYTPPCTVCHPGSVGTGTATSAFALAMKAHGLMPLDDPTVAAALTAMTEAKVDSDCNGIIDTDQLKDGRDPSTGEYIDGSGKTAPAEKGCSSSGSGGTGGTVLPAYGCGAPQQAQLARGPTPWQGAAWIVAIAMIALGRARGRRT